MIVLWRIALHCILKLLPFVQVNDICVCGKTYAVFSMPAFKWDTEEKIKKKLCIHHILSLSSSSSSFVCNKMLSESIVNHKMFYLKCIYYSQLHTDAHTHEALVFFLLLFCSSGMANEFFLIYNSISSIEPICYSCNPYRRPRPRRRQRRANVEIGYLSFEIDVSHLIFY